MSYIGNSPENVLRNRRAIYEFVATAGQTAFSGVDSNGATLDLLQDNEQSVFLNGVRIIATDDYTVSGDTLTLLQAASVGDILIVETQGEVANATTYTRTESDQRYVNYNGDVISGNIQIAGDLTANSLAIDTDTLYVDATNNKVGIGTNNPQAPLDIDGAYMIIGDGTVEGAIGRGNSLISGQTPSDFVISASISNDLVLSTGAADRLHILSTGNVGIGIDTPIFKLDVAGTARFTADVYAENHIYTQRIRHNGDVDNYISFGTDIQSFVTGNSTRAQFSNTLVRFNQEGLNQDFQVFGQNDDNLFYADASTDRIGIGTDTPATTLNVESSSYPYVRVTNTGYTGFDIGQADSSEGGAALVKLRDVADMDFYTADLNRMRISSTGNVGIGLITTDPSHKLHVSGDIKSDQYLLDAIVEDISVTAADVFVYDTRKDSDGGAWRKRTQHTSWYNETLNTSTRGSRKEFPAVAVIVAETLKITIYDGDDPDMPMWMVFNHNAQDGGATPDTASSYYTIGPYNITSVEILNGNLAIGTYRSAGDAGIVRGLTQVNFVSDQSKIITPSHGTYQRAGSLSTRNEGKRYYKINSEVLVNGQANDVAMTVLPNAPIDADTGLPVPTIAVATNGGVSVIKDDGTVVDLKDNAGGQSTKVMFTQDGKLAYAHDGATSIRIDSIPSADFTYGSNKVSRGSSEEFYINSGLVSSGWGGDTPVILSGSFAYKGLIVKSDSKFGLAQTGSKGLTLLDRSLGKDGRDKNMVAYTSSDYNTGWMNGDIKLATLSDTDTTSLSGTNRCAADDFSSGWTVTSGSNMSISNNQLAVVDTSNVGSTFCDQTITTIVGQEYVIDVTATGTSGTGIGLYVTGYGGPVLGYQWEPTYSFTATTTSTVVRLYRYEGHTGSGTITSVIIKEAASDRSVNGNGLQVFGTVTKTAVATGAELVRYSFGANIYLKAPGTTVPTGTNDSCYMWWSVDTSGDMTQFYLGDPSASGSVPTNGINVWSYGPGMKYRYGANQFDATASDGIGIGKWNHHCMMSRNGLLEVYINGKFAHRAAGAHNGITETDLYVGKGHYNYDHSNGMALFRISATAPSAEQIAKIYNDEKYLFQENAKATLYGSSDAVIALAYDDDTELLHAGTSAGRSVFQGLRRIDNTTDAVGAAISASNGLVAED